MVSSLTLDELPPCRPPLINYGQLKGVVGLDVSVMTVGVQRSSLRMASS